MTFIASVIAKDGIAVVADSLVSSFTETLERADWEDFIEKNRAVAKKKNGFSFSEEEITQLFQTKPSHTKDFENKLFEYDDYTLISTAGSAIINNKRIVNLVAEIKKKTQKNKRSYRQQGIVRKIEEFCEILHQEVSAHMNEHGSIGETTFIFSHFDKNSLTPHVFKVSVKPSSDINSVSINTNTVKELIVCDGQPGIAYRILYGGIIEGLEIKNLILDSLKQELGKNGIVEGKQLPNGFFKSLDETQTMQIINSQIKEAQMFHISNISLQQAADLAYLLLKVERDFQAYTKEIPTVGGHIKLATINENGINFILGKSIIKPTRHL